jgi:hypothetical protein
MSDAKKRDSVLTKMLKTPLQPKKARVSPKKAKAEMKACQF